MIKKFTAIFLFLLSSSLSSAVLTEEFVFINAPFASCHASTLAETASGKLLCAWYGGTEEGANDVGIWLSSLEGSTWSAPKEIAKAEGVPCWNPVLFTMPSKEIILFYKAGRNPQSWSGFLQRSYDEGLSWTSKEMLPAGVIGPTKNKPLLLESGALLCGSSIESWGCWGCWVDITTDGGVTWTKSSPINMPKQMFGMIQPTLLSCKNGKIKLLARSRQGFICASTSLDQGRTWSYATVTSLPNPNSAIDAITLRDGRILLVYNPSKENRYPLILTLSENDGESWTDVVLLEDNPGEYSYPSIIQTKDGMVHISYTWNRESIRHVVLNPDEFIRTKVAGGSMRKPIVTSDLARSLKRGIYEHYSGRRYQVMDIAHHSETLEEHVVYRALYDEGRCWVRPISMFCETVRIEGKETPRFRHIE